MKKSFVSFVALLGLLTVMVGSAQATAFSEINGSYIIKPRQAVVVSAQPGQIGAITDAYTAAVDVVQGNPVKLVYNFYLTSTAETYLVGVSRSATLGDQDIIGTVNFPTGTVSASAGTTVDVAGVGSTVLVLVGANVTVGGKLVQSGTAGLLTPSAALSETVSTNLSSTAHVARVIETKSSIAVGGTLVKARIIKP